MSQFGYEVGSKEERSVAEIRVGLGPSPEKTQQLRPPVAGDSFRKEDDAPGDHLKDELQNDSSFSYLSLSENEQDEQDEQIESKKTCFSRVGGFFSESKKYLTGIVIPGVYSSNNFLPYYKKLADLTVGKIPDADSVYKIATAVGLFVLCSPLLGTTFKTTRDALKEPEPADEKLEQSEPSPKTAKSKCIQNVAKKSAAFIKTAGVTASTVGLIEENISPNPSAIIFPAAAVAIINFLVNLASFKYTHGKEVSERKPALAKDDISQDEVAEKKNVLSQIISCCPEKKMMAAVLLSAGFAITNNGFYVPDFANALERLIGLGLEGPWATGISTAIPSIMALVGLPTNYYTTLAVVTQWFNIPCGEKEKTKWLEASSSMLALLKSVGAMTTLITQLDSFVGHDSNGKAILLGAIGLTSLGCNILANRALQARGSAELELATRVVVDDVEDPSTVVSTAHAINSPQYTRSV